MKKKRVVILGSTGSIGKNTLDVISRYRERFEVAALSCHENLDSLAEQIKLYRPVAVAITGLEDKYRVHDHSGNIAGIPYSITGSVKVYKGYTGLLSMLDEEDYDVVVNGISGAAGLRASVKTLKQGKDLALANKETVVMAGELVLNLADRYGAQILPVDSEHSAIFNLIRIAGDEVLDNVEEILLTASGGAFRELGAEELEGVKVEDALKHPTWEMGKKITIDSASMANKGLEVIEACQLFHMEPSRVKVVIHPESVVHSLVRTKDGILYAQLSYPDMRAPILNALSYPHILDSTFGKLELDDLSLNFEKPQMKKYKMLKLGYLAAERGTAYRVVYNASNEIAVDNFLCGKIRFVDIPFIVEKVMSGQWEVDPMDIESILKVDDEARNAARRFIDRLVARNS